MGFNYSTIFYYNRENERGMRYVEIKTRITLELYTPAMVQNIKCMQHDTKRILEIYIKSRGNPLTLSPLEHECFIDCDGNHECNIANEGYIWCYIPSVLTESAGVKSATLHINAKSGIGRGEELASSRFYISVLPVEYDKAEIDERIDCINGANN